MRNFARMTKLTDIAGRGDYISNPGRQEEIVLQSNPVDWKPYQEYERQNQKTSRKNNEGRELMVWLPNEWYKLPPEELQAKIEPLAKAAAGKDTDLQWAVHWNKARTNFHMHVIFSERKKEKEPGRWDRDVYLTQDGKVARRKADRARLQDGSIAPPVHQKGDLKGGFSSKDPKYARKAWLAAVKKQLQAEFEALGVTFDAPNPLHQYHEGKGKDSRRIRRKNLSVKFNNSMWPLWRKHFPEVSEIELKKLALQAVHTDTILVLKHEPDGSVSIEFLTHQEHRQRIKALEKKQPQKVSLKDQVIAADQRAGTFRKDSGKEQSH